MELHNLDLGAARFIELQLSLVFRNVYEAKSLEWAALSLVKQWPALDQRMNIVRTKFTPSDDPSLSGLWTIKQLDQSLDDALPFLGSKQPEHLIDSDLINRLVYLKESYTDHLFPRALTVRAASLRDACIIHFTVQHPFCDANGVYRIAKAYGTLLRGQDLLAMSPRRPLELRADTEVSPSLDEGMEPSAARHQAFFSHGWSSLLIGGWRQRRNEFSGPRRLERSAFVPDFVIDKFSKDAERMNIQVTRHDILMAWIYIASMPNISQLSHKQSVGPPQFSFIMNISKLLEQDQDFHNPWLVITVPDPVMSDLWEQNPILAAAKHIREAIMDARRLAPVREIVGQHPNVKTIPMGPADWGCREPNLAVSSWTNLDLYGLSFKAQNGLETKSEFVQVGIKVCPLLRLAGLSFADGILTWNGKNGFWMQGKLHEIAWARIANFQAFA